jgi:hypothetical protein
MITLSAPKKSGYTEQFADQIAAEAKAAELLGIAVEEMETEVSCDGETTYCYPAGEDIGDGAYAVQYRGTPESIDEEALLEEEVAAGW